MKRALFTFILLTAGLAMWYWLQGADFFAGPQFSSDPQVADLQRLQKSMVEQSATQPGSMPDEKQMRAMGEKIRELSDEQRRAFFESSRSIMMGMMEARMKRFFELPPAEQQKQLDEDIDRMEKGRKEGRGGPFGGGPPGGGGEKKPSDGANSGTAKADSKGGNRRERFANMSPEERNERRKEMLSHTTPENRAMFTAYKTRLDDRMRERGLQPRSFP